MSQYPDIRAGLTVTGNLLRAMLPIESVLDSDTTPWNNNTTYADTGLVVPLEANASYLGWTTLFYVGPAAADLKFRYSIPTGATGRRGGTAAGTGATGADPSSERVWVTSNLTSDIVIGDSGSVHFPGIERFRINTTNAGSLAVQAAQFVATVGDTIVLAHSSLQVKRIS